MELFIGAHEYYVYDKLFDEMEEICCLGNKSVDDLF
jgi:hypothetical protein